MKRIAIRTLIGSIAVSAALGIYALLAGDFGDLEIRILFTSLTVSGTSILAMGCSAALERPAWGRAPQVGIGLALLTALLTLIAIWAKTEDEVYWKLNGTIALYAVATAHTCLLSLSRLAPRYLWAQFTSIGIAYSFVSLCTVMMWAELDEEGWWRFMGVLGILYAAFTLLVPIYHRLSRPGFEGRQPELSHCPLCGAAISSPVPASQTAACDTCGASFRVEVL